MPLDLRVPVVASLDVTGAREPFTPGLLQQTAPGVVWHPVDLATPLVGIDDHAVLEATTACRCLVTKNIATALERTISDKQVPGPDDVSRLT